jgi:hypothetical protein
LAMKLIWACIGFRRWQHPLHTVHRRCEVG